MKYHGWGTILHATLLSSQSLEYNTNLRNEKRALFKRLFWLAWNLMLCQLGTWKRRVWTNRINFSWPQRCCLAFWDGVIVWSCLSEQKNLHPLKWMKVVFCLLCVLIKDLWLHSYLCSRVNSIMAWFVVGSTRPIVTVIRDQPIRALAKLLRNCFWLWHVEQNWLGVLGFGNENKSFRMNCHLGDKHALNHPGRNWNHPERQTHSGGEWSQISWG